MKKPGTKTKAARAPLTDEELLQPTPPRRRPLTLTPEETQRLGVLRGARERTLAERVDRIRAEQAPILVELRSIGVDVPSVGHLDRHSPHYKDALSILLKHLLMPYSSATRAAIANVLSAPEPMVRKAWPTLVDAYKNARCGVGMDAPGDTVASELSEKDAMAYLLAVAVTDATLQELIGLVKDRGNGESRLLFLTALRKRRNKNPLVREIINDLASDPDLRKEIASWRPSTCAGA